MFRKTIKKTVTAAILTAAVCVVQAQVMTAPRSRGRNQSAVIVAPQANQDNANTFTDSRDGMTYRIVTIGNQTWMAENLNFAISEMEGSSWCYNHEYENCQRYGTLYDWQTAQWVCPDGWRLPTQTDLNTLLTFVGGEALAGRKLKARPERMMWVDDGGGTDEFGFSALPGGYRCHRCTSGNFSGFGEWGFWWSASEENATDAIRWFMGYDREYVGSDLNDKTDGLSVRCVRGTAERSETAPSRTNENCWPTPGGQVCTWNEGTFRCSQLENHPPNCVKY